MERRLCLGVRAWINTKNIDHVASEEPEHGCLRSIVLVGVNHEGSRYVVSMLGDNSEWVKNVRAAGGESFIKRGRLRPVVLKEIPPENRAQILKAWSHVATSGRQHLPVPDEAPNSAFEAIAADYPVFRIDPASSERSG